LSTQPARAIIFANGACPPLPPGRLGAADLLVAADGGARCCRALGLWPHVVIGDCDSLSVAELAELAAHGAQVLRYPTHKDYTDLELALQYAADQGAAEALVLGALGQRWDQTLANLLLPAAFPKLRLRLVDGAQELCLLADGQTLQLDGQPGDTVSLIPVGGAAEGVQTRGLEYPLHGETLHFGATRGVSNVLAALPAEVRLARGQLMVVLIRQTQP
jgi:thiamine pyrophosphokinase